jgi:ribosomal protein S18 acetylase RimI-like enzyme
MDPAIRIRPGALADSAAVLELWGRSEAAPSPTDTPAAVSRLLREPAAVLLVALDGVHVVGTVIAGWDGWRGNLYRLAVRPDHRRRGIARALVAEAEALLRRWGCVRISALVEHHHPSAVGFWEAAGYGRDARMARYIKTF